MSNAMKKRKRPRETALSRLGTLVCRFAFAPIGGVDADAVEDITDRLRRVDGAFLAPAWAEVVGRILRLERLATQSHRTRASLRWLRRWEVWIGEEMLRRAAPPSASDVAARVLFEVSTVTAEFDVSLALQRAEAARRAILGDKEP